MTCQSQPLRALFRVKVWKNRQKFSKFLHKRTKIWESIGPILMKLGQSVHLRALCLDFHISVLDLFTSVLTIACCNCDFQETLELGTIHYLVAIATNFDVMLLLRNVLMVTYCWLTRLYLAEIKLLILKGTLRRLEQKCSFQISWRLVFLFGQFQKIWLLLSVAGKMIAYRKSAYTLFFYKKVVYKKVYI